MNLGTYDVYTEVQYLIDELNQMGEERWGSALREALSTSSSSTEVLGETRFALQKLRASQAPDRLGLTQRVDEALSYLDQIFASWSESERSNQ